MKRVACALVALLGASVLVGCEASGRVDTDHDHDVNTSSLPADSHTTYQKTTVEHPNGDTSVHTEKRTENY